jgi:hypothetical protein
MTVRCPVSVAGASGSTGKKASGAKTDRPELAKLLRALEPGDVLIVTTPVRTGSAGSPCRGAQGGGAWGIEHHKSVTLRQGSANFSRRDFFRCCRRNAFEDPYWTGRTTYRRYRRGD